MWVGGGKITSKVAAPPQGQAAPVAAKDDHAAIPAKDPSKLTASVAPSGRAESAVTFEAVLRSGVGRKSVGELVVVVEVLDTNLDDAVGAQRVGFANERTLLVEPSHVDRSQLELGFA